MADKGSNSRSLVHVQDLVLDSRIDNSVTPSSSYFNLNTAPGDPPYPRHIFSPMRTVSGGYNISRELRVRLSRLEDEFTDNTSPINPIQDEDKSLLLQSARSEISGANSLFQAGDDESVDKYMTDLSIIEESKDLSSSPNPQLSQKSSPKTKKKHTALDNLTVKYLNMSEWKAESKEPKAILLLVKINEEIILRESLINSLKFALDVMDKKYWQYCVERIKATEAGHTIKSEILVLLYNQLIDAQKHVTVIIAHIRSLSIQIIENVKLLRNVYARNIKTSAPVSIYWKNQNYLLKIRTDLDFINETITIRLWLGFTARGLIIPPHTVAASAAAAALTTISDNNTTTIAMNNNNTSNTNISSINTPNPHDPKAHWLRTHRKVYKDWFRKHEAFIKASWKAGKSKVIFKRDRKFLSEEDNLLQSSASSAGVIPIQAMFNPLLTAMGDVFSPQRTFYTPTSSRSETPLPQIDESKSASWDENDFPMQSARTQRDSLFHSASEEFTMTPPITNRKEPEASETSQQPSIGANISNAAQEDCEGLKESNGTSLTVEMLHTNIPNSTTIPPSIVSDANHGGIELCYSEDSSYSAMSTPFGGGAFAFSPRAEGEPSSPFPVSPSRYNPFPEVMSIPAVGTVEGSEGVGEGSEITGIAISSKVSAVSADAAILSNNTASTPLPPVTVATMNDITRADSEPQQQQQQRNHSGTASAEESVLVSRTGTAGAAGGRGDSTTMNSSTTTTKGAEQNHKNNDHHLVPEWIQLREYVKHSWGRIEVQEDDDLVDDHVTHPDNTCRDNRTHGLNDPYDGFNAQNHAAALNPGYDPGLIDAKQGMHEAVVGFQDSLTQQPQSLLSLADPTQSQQQQQQQQYYNDHTNPNNNDEKKERSYIYIQNKHISSQFWSTVDHNPLVIEAATGFEECFPSIYIVPPMPMELLNKAESSLYILNKEYELYKKIEKEKKECLAYKEYVQSQVSIETLNNYIFTQNYQNSTTTDNAANTSSTSTTTNALLPSSAYASQYSSALKLRHQGSTELLKGISLQHASSALALDSSSIETLLYQPNHNNNSNTSSNSNMMMNAAPTDTVVHHENNKIKERNEDDENNIFLTNLQEYNDSEFSLPLPLSQYNNTSTNNNNEYTILNAIQPNKLLYGCYLDLNRFHSFRIEASSKLRQKIENKIQESRKIVEYKDDNIFPTICTHHIGKREPNHNTSKWYDDHLIKMQSIIRIFLAKRKLKKLKIRKKFNRSAQKVRTLVIGFMWRYRQRQKYWEQRFEAFLMRKIAVKKFRSSMTLARFFRKIVRARRKIRAEDEKQRLFREGLLNSDKNNSMKSRLNGSLIMSNTIATTPTGSSSNTNSIPSSSTMIQTPISRNIRRKFGQMLSLDHDPSIIHNNGVQNTIDSTLNNTTANSTTPNTRHVTISNTITECTLPTITTTASAATTSRTTTTTTTTTTTSTHKFQPPQLPTATSAVKTSSSNPYATYKIIPQERLRSLEAPGPYDESKRREELTNTALNLIAKVNRGKILNDTMQNSRLIPTQSVPNLSNKQTKMRKFATKSYEFLNIPNQAPPQSLIKSSSDVFIGPIPKRVVQQSYPTTNTTTRNEPNSPVGVSTTVSYDGGGFMNATLSRSTSSLPAPTTTTTTTATTISAKHIRASYELGGIPSLRSAAAGAPVSVGTIMPPMSATGSNTGSAGSGNALLPSHSTSAKLRSTGANVLNHHTTTSSSGSSGLSHTTPTTATLTSNSIHMMNNNSNSSSRRASAIGSPESVGSKPQGKASLFHIGEVNATPGSAGHGGVAALIRYNSTGLTLKSKKQQEAHEKAEAERIQLRSVLYKYM